MSLSQRTVIEYYPSKRRGGEYQRAKKRRKVSEDSSLDVHCDLSVLPQVKESQGGVNLRDADTNKPAEESIGVTDVSLIVTDVSLIVTPTKHEVSPFKVRTVSDLSSPIRSPSSKIKHVPPMAPEPLSRGMKLVQLARQKALANTPIKRPKSQIFQSPLGTVDGFISSKSTYKNERMTAKRKLILGSSDACLMSKKNISSPLIPEKNLEDEPRLHEFGAIEFESPTKKGKTRFHNSVHLSLGTGTSTEAHKLPLPEKYKVLSEKFHCTDTVVGMLLKRKETCTFSKLKNAVEKMTRRELKKCNLAQIKTVYPTAFSFDQERNIPGDYNDRKRYQLTIKRVLEDGETQPSLSSSSLVYRRRVFNNNLISIMRGHHRDFLAHLNPPLEIPDHKVLRWHPEFPLDTIPEIEEADLPIAPAVIGGVMSPKDVFTIGMTVQKPQATPIPTTTGVDPALNGVPVELLEKIRAKESSKAALCITRNSVKEKELEMIQRLPDFISILRGYFIAEKKAAILWDEVLQKLNESHPSHLPPDQLEEHLNFLSEVSRGWVSFVSIRKRKYVKINKNTDLKYILNKLRERKKRLEV